MGKACDSRLATLFAAVSCSLLLVQATPKDTIAPIIPTGGQTAVSAKQTNVLRRPPHFALAASFFLGLQYAAEAGWATTIKRIIEAVTWYLPVGLSFLLLIFILGQLHVNHIYHWMAEGVATPGHENYDKVIYGIKHQLTLRRKDDNDDAILKSLDKNDEGVFKVPDGKIILSKLTWRIPHVTLSDKYMMKLANDIQNKTILNISFLRRQCESIEINEGQKQFDWRLNITAGSEKPRLIILAFQKNKDDNQIMNPSIFDHCNVTNAFVQLNSERYPEMDLQLDFNENQFTTGYKMLTDYFNHVLHKENCSISLTEYRNLYPLLVFDVSRQSEKLKNSVTDIKIKANFKKNIAKGTKAYALILSDQILKLQSDGNKMNFIY